MDSGTVKKKKKKKNLSSSVPYTLYHEFGCKLPFPHRVVLFLCFRGDSPGFDF